VTTALRAFFSLDSVTVNTVVHMNLRLAKNRDMYMDLFRMYRDILVGYIQGSFAHIYRTDIYIYTSFCKYTYQYIYVAKEGIDVH